MQPEADRLAVVEREAGDAAEQREVREVVEARSRRAVRVGLQGPAAVLAEEEPAARVQHLLRDDPEPLPPQPGPAPDLARKPNLRSAHPSQPVSKAPAVCCTY